MLKNVTSIYRWFSDIACMFYYSSAYIALQNKVIALQIQIVAF